MRRYLVMEESRFPQEVTPLFTNLERNGNPWEISNDTRAEWAQKVRACQRSPKTPMSRYSTGSAAWARSTRATSKVATAFAKVMQHAGVRFGILGPEESCTGDPARRIGNEYLWQTLAPAERRDAQRLWLRQRTRR